MFVNFLTVNDFRCGTGNAVGENQYEQFEEEGDEVPIIHSYFESDEPDKFFEGMKILYKENRVLERIFDGQKIKQGFVDYIVKK